MKRRVAPADNRQFALAVHELLRRIRFDDVDSVCSTGISRTECHVLEVVSLHGPLSVNDVTSHMRLNKSTISRVVTSLTEKGLIRSEAAGDDARRLSISVTAKGKSLWGSIVRATADGYGEALADCTPAERNAVMRVLERMTRRG